ncbi:MAG TPA: NAD-dependent epimerase/dehydratase family protein [Pyrinomonadaceae bacterium]|nr:NAD-dependent epimerase/dehydratase family protein [Pyrinomonadaceae bacterium]
MKDTILVTGGAGFLGSHVADCLIEAGNDVIVMDDLSGGFLDNVHPDTQFIQGSILDHKLVDSIFNDHRIRDVYHLAAYAAEGLSHFIKRFNYQNNLIGSVNLINNCVNHGVECFVFTSSIAVYGSNQLPMSEGMMPQPEDPYGIAKFAVEQELRASRHMFGLNHVIFRPHSVYGERQNIGDPYRNVIGIFMNQIMQDKPMTIFGDGTQTRAFTYAKDIAPVIAQAHLNSKAYGHVFNVGADTPYDLNFLAECVAEAMGKQAEITYLPARKEVAHAYSSHDKVRKFFKCPPETTLNEGLSRMSEWVKKVGTRQGSPFSNIEIERGLPPSWRQLMSK